ncbi:hypothetical protein [Crossiella sp. S99.1]|uniref:hypothetical protein n=1 Tax=Crossiella sp. S99.1 TaxID=2936271 RepID=UPI001FFE3182|nr:hypothetical protein [Crossiella sp. S99.1]
MPILAIAGENGQAPATVTAAQLRHRLTDQTEYTLWLHATLQRMGYPLSPLRVPGLGGRDADIDATATLLQELITSASPASDDPVITVWRHAARISGGTSEMTCGTVVDEPMTCPLWTRRAEMIAELDTLLIHDHGGYPAGTWVRTRGIPGYIDPSGQTAAELGLVADRALISGPAWTHDEQARQVIVPPTSYFLRFRPLDPSHWSAAVSSSRFGPVPQDNLELDLAGFPLNTASPTPRPHPATRAEPADPHLTPPAVAPDGRESPDPDSDTREALTFLDPDRSAHLPRALANTEDPSRAAALRRLWRLRDQELTHCGETDPKHIAERVAAGSWFPPEQPRHFDALLFSEQLRQTGHYTTRRADWCEPDQPLLLGEPRQQMLAWLDALRRCSRRQATELDGWDPPVRLPALRRMLAGEGFTEVLDVHDNVDAGQGSVELFLVHHGQGWLASVSAVDHGDGPEPSHVTIYFNTAAVDREMLALLPYDGGLARDKHDPDAATNIHAGHFTVRYRKGRPYRSLRLPLTMLLALGRPVLPWYSPPSLYLGPGGTPPQVQQSMLDRLPPEVHTLLGPNLTLRLPPT